jgi:threonine aldolase
MHLDLDTVQTNLVIFSPRTPHPEGPSFIQELARAGVKIGDIGSGRFRAVTHHGISQSDIHEAVRIVRKTWRELRY